MCVWGGNRWIDTSYRVLVEVKGQHSDFGSLLSLGVLGTEFRLSDLIMLNHFAD